MRADASGARGDHFARAVLKAVALLALAALLLHPTATAEEASRGLPDGLGFDALERLSDALGGPDARRIAEMALSGELHPDADLPKKLLRKLASAVQHGLLRTLRALSTPVLATLLLRLITDRRSGALTLLCRLAVASSLVGQFTEAARLAEETMSAAVRVADVASPVLCAALTLSDAGASAAVLSPISALCVGAIEGVLKGMGLPLCALAAIVAAGSGLSEAYRLDRLFDILRRTAIWGVGGLLGAFTAWMTIEGRLCAAQDTATAQAVHRAIGGMVPIIGRSVSNSMGALLTSAVSVRNAVGVTGMAVALGVCAKPLTRLTAHMLSLRLASAVIEPVADPGIARVVADFADISRMLLALCLGSAILVALLAGACLGLFGL